MSGKKVLPISPAANSKEVLVCHLADIHLGYRRYNRLTKSGQNQREADVNAAFRESISKIIVLKPSLTVIAGDLFHHVRPTNAIIAFCFREIKRLAFATASPVIILAGNHEFPKRQDTGSALSVLGEIENVYIADQQIEKFTFDALDLAVTCLPHAALLKLGEETLQADTNYRFNLLAMHAQFGGRASDFGGVEINLKTISPYQWDYIALGHYHDATEIAPNMWYSGAIERTSSNLWNESGKAKGFLEIRLPSRQIKFHPLSSPREIIVLPPIDAEFQDANEVQAEIDQRIASVAGGIDGKIVRLEILNISSKIQRSLNHKTIRDMRSRCLNLTIEMRRPIAFPAAAPDQPGTPRKLQEELAEYCAAIQDESIAKDKIKDLLLSYLLKIESQHETVTAEP